MKNEFLPEKEKKKADDNRHDLEMKLMLKAVPKWTCMVLFGVVAMQTIGITALYIKGTGLSGKELAAFIESISQIDIISTGIAVIAVAVSVWVGLNIYISISKEELKEIGDRFDEYKAEMDHDFDSLKEEYTEWQIKKNSDLAEKAGNNINEKFVKFEENSQKRIEERLETLSEVMVQNLIGQIERQQNEYMINSFFAAAFRNRDAFAGIGYGMILDLIKLENDSQRLCALYETNKYNAAFEFGKSIKDEYEKYIKANEEKVGQNRHSDIYHYLQTRLADSIFYKNAAGRRLKSGKQFDIYEMDRVVEIYKNARSYIEKNGHSEQNVVLSYLDNTIGYTLDLMNQESRVEERVKDSQERMRSSVALIGTEHPEKKARYLPTLALHFNESMTTPRQRKSTENQSKKILMIISRGTMWVQLCWRKSQMSWGFQNGMNCS